MPNSCSRYPADESFLYATRKKGFRLYFGEPNRICTTMSEKRGLFPGNALRGHQRWTICSLKIVVVFLLDPPRTDPTSNVWLRHEGVKVKEGRLSVCTSDYFHCLNIKGPYKLQHIVWKHAFLFLRSDDSLLHFMNLHCEKDTAFSSVSTSANVCWKSPSAICCSLIDLGRLSEL